MQPFKDISQWQGAYNVAADPDPILAMKASGGDNGLYLDSQLVHNYSETVSAGKVPILYHFAGGADPVVEASYFISAASPLAEGDVYAIDWEIEHADPVGWVNTFVTHVHDVTGAWPLLYIDRDRLGRFDWSPVLANCGLWIAAPDVSFDTNIPGIGIYVAQQGPIVNGVDSDMWFGTIEELKAYGYHTPNTSAPVPVPTPEPALAPAPVPDPTPVPEPQPAPTPDPVTPPVPPVATPVVSPPEGTPDKKSVSFWTKVLQLLLGLIGIQLKTK